ncbi:ketoacyl-synt-domain-containing protein [Byssothecium circinans]|uniref:Ketoacyl-synt-domain-containing protein n=1 Tax=Byssothecium circinans TaxID=147558 RepID=A0A6A5UN22_9PLEO|nr:ketoacyl-synt-domain-containing protein [Byssothecium circinans]
MQYTDIDVSSNTEATILLFGDQTDPWVDGLDQLYSQAVSSPWLQSFLERVAEAITTETKSIGIDDALQNALGHFSSLQDLADRYRHGDDELGVVRCLLLHTVRAGTLLNYDFETLYEACIEVTRALVRLCKLTSVRSRAVEDRPGVWGWTILGISADDLRKALDQFQQNAGIPSIKRAKVGVSGAGWNTVIGPPSVLQLFINRCLAVKDLTKNPLEIRALQHTLDISQEDIDFIVGNNSTFLDRPLCSAKRPFWGMDDPMAAYANWRELLRDVVSHVLSRPLDIPKARVRVTRLGSSSHASYLASVFKTAGKSVTVEDEKHLLCADAEPMSSYHSKIAIVGMAAQGPGGHNVDELWHLIMSKQDMAREVPKDRFDVDEYYCPEHGRGGKKCQMTTRYGCFMDKPGNFDARFFHISPREAMLMDPGHRQFLMSTYEALEMAGYSDGATKTTDPHRIAAFFGQCTDDWHDASHPTLGCDAYTLQGVQRAFGPGRLAWHFKWEGPTYSFDSACASTTASIHLACMSLKSKDIDMAVAGAANILNSPHSFTCLSKSGVLSDTGNCKPFRDDADGYCRADFVGSVVLKRVEDAITHNDKILAVIAGSGRNHSGNSTSITTSDAGAQERLFRKVMNNARVTPDDISYVEMHGTGTPVGDPAEMSAVANTFKHRRAANGPLLVGGVKANFGHAEAAAGMSELLKCLKILETDIAPPQAGMPHALNPRFPPLKDINIEIPSEPQQFKNDSKPRRILLNNFDAAGGNACMILESYAPTGDKPTIADARKSHVIAISARTQAAHQGNMKNSREWLRANPGARLEDIAYSTTARRMHHSFRFACSATTTEELLSKLETAETATAPSQSSPTVFVFGGQGSHYAGMGSELYRTSPTFRETVDLCVTMCRRHGFPPFLDLITNEEALLSGKGASQTQLAVLTLEIGLVAFWRSAGVRPSLVMGHSLGEYAALYASGVLSLVDVLYVVGERARLLLQRCEVNTCAMLSTSMGAKDVQYFLKSRPQYSSCGIACMNSPSATVISGITEEIDQLQKELTDRSKTLEVPYGFHSVHMDPMLSEYISLAEGVTFSTPSIPVASTLLGRIVEGAGTFNARYLGQQTRQPVDFVGSLNAVKEKLNDPVWFELGPSPVCSSFVRSTLYQSKPTMAVLSSLDAPGREHAWASISKCLVTAYTYGVNVDWLGLHEPYKNSLKLLTLPAYSWDLKDYWATYTDVTEERATALSSTAAPKQETISTCAQFIVKESSSPSGVQVTLRASLSNPGLTALINGHRMLDQPICPGSVFCEAAMAAATYALKFIGRKADAVPGKLAIRNPVMSRPLTKHLVGPNGDLLTTISMKSPSSNDIQVVWKASPLERGASYELGTCTLTVNNDVDSLQAGWDRMAYFVKARIQEIIQAAKDGRGHRLRPDIFYALFAATVQYDSTYQAIKEAFVSDDFTESAAEIVLRDEPADTRFVASPYWGEASANLAGFTVNANPQNICDAPGECFINSGFVSFEQTVPYKPGRSYFTYVRVSQPDKDSRSCDIFIFDSDYRIVAQCCKLAFRRISEAVLTQILSGKSKSPSSHSHSAPKVREVQDAPPSGPTKPIETPEVKEATSAPPSTGAFPILLESIARETGMEVAELTDDVAPEELGVDSIMAIEVTASVSTATGLELLPSFLIEHPTIADLRRALEALAPSPAASSAAKPELTSSERGTSSPAESSSISVIDTRDSNDEFVVVEEAPPSVPPAPVETDDNSPLPSVRITLLKGDASSAKLPPFYMIADGTSSIGSYIHLPAHIQSKMKVYGVDSPYIRCPGRLTVDVGIPGAAKLIVEDLLKKQPKGLPFWIGGFSGGAMIAYEVSRQLSAAGHTVDGLLLIDMCSPRTENVPVKGDLGLAMFDVISRRDKSGVWKMTDNTRRHLGALFASVAVYNPPPLRSSENPPAKRTAIIWARRGMLKRCDGDTTLLRVLAEQNIPTTAYPGFMEDPRLGAVGWSLADKREVDLGPNGWDRYVGKDIWCSSIDGDHLDLPTPDFVHLLGGAIEQAFKHFAKG